MWIFEFLPNWTFQLTFFLGIVVYLVATTLKVLPYATVFKYLSVVVVLVSTYFVGAKGVDDVWRTKALELEVKIRESEARAQEKNVEVQTQVVEKTKVVREKGQDIIKYVDREVVKTEEVVKYIEKCPALPKEIIDAHNKAATIAKEAKP